MISSRLAYAECTATRLAAALSALTNAVEHTAKNNKEAQKHLKIARDFLALFTEPMQGGFAIEPLEEQYYLQETKEPDKERINEFVRLLLMSKGKQA